MKSIQAAVTLACLFGTMPAIAQSGPADSAALRVELEQARAEIADQRRRLDAQEARLRALEGRLAGPTGLGPGAVPSGPGGAVASVAQGSAASTPGDPATIQQAPIQTADARQAPPERVGARPAGQDRPPEVAVLGSEGSVVTRRGQLTGELQFDYARADRNRALFRGIEIVDSVLIGAFNINESRQDILSESFGLRYGLTDRLEFGARIPILKRYDRSVLVPVQGSTNNDAAREVDTSAEGGGFGDLELSARYQLLTGRGGLPFLVGNLQVVAPTGTNPFAVPRRADGSAIEAATGAGFWGISPSITAILPSDPAVLFGTIGYTYNLGRDVDTIIPPVRILYVKPGDALSFSGGIGLSLNERTSMNLGYAHTWAFGTRTRTALAEVPADGSSGETETKSRDLQLGRLLFGITYRASDRASINWSVEIGATDDATDLRTVLRLPLILITPQ